MQQELETTWMKIGKQKLVKAILKSDDEVREQIADNLRAFT